MQHDNQPSIERIHLRQAAHVEQLTGKWRITAIWGDQPNRRLRPKSSRSAQLHIRLILFSFFPIATSSATIAMFSFASVALQFYLSALRRYTQILDTHRTMQNLNLRPAAALMFAKR
jgi:hypothetical protein